MTDTETLLPELDKTLSERGAEAAARALVDQLRERGEWRPMLDALLLQARVELGLPAVMVEPLSSLPEPKRTEYEEKYVDALRHVGKCLLDTGDIPAAWPYYRVLGEKDAVVEALDAAEISRDDPRMSALIEVAFNAGVHPRRGFELLLEQYGICSAITAFEHLPPDESVRGACAAKLVRTLHDQLSTNVRADVEQRGGKPAPDATIPQMLEGRDDVFADDAYHIDISHLASVVRLSPLLSDRGSLEQAAELCAYGRNLSSRLRYDDMPPFEHTYEDHAHYLNALLGRDVDTSIAHFHDKLAAGADDPEIKIRAAEVLVRLLERLGRVEEAIDVASEHLADVPDGALSCSSLSALCVRASRLDRLAEASRRSGDAVRYLAARLNS